MKRLMKGFPVLAGLVGLFMTGSAAAVPLTLSSGTGNAFAGSTPCIFTGTGGGGCSLLVGSGPAPAATPTGGTSSYTGSSYTYTVSNLISALGGDNQFNIGIDSNWSGNTPGDSEFLNLFQVLFNGAVAYDYTGGGAMDSGANGTGNANFVLSGPVDLSTLAGTDTVSFNLSMSSLTDGFEQFFLVAAGFVPPPDPCMIDPMAPGCPGDPGNGNGDPGNGNGDPGNGDPMPVPEPGPMTLLGLALVGMVSSRRRLFA